MQLRKLIAFTVGAGLALTPVLAAPAGAASHGKPAATNHHGSHHTKAHKKKHHKKHHAKSAATKLPSPHLGQVAKDGDFAFTVKSVQCGVTHVGTTTFGEDVPGGAQWCLVSMSVENDKTSAQDFGASNQKAIDAKGRQLSADSSAIAYLPNDDSAIFTTVNPGVAITVVVPYQLAATDSIAKFVLHDSAFSGGVTVYNVGG